MGLFSFLKNKFSKNTPSDNSLLSYDKGLNKAKKGFIDKLNKLNDGENISSDYFEKLEEILIEADIGVNLTMEIIDKLVNIIKKEKITKLNDVNEKLIEIMFENYFTTSEPEIKFNSKPTVLLVVGVNGVGKTTTIAKLANRYINQGKKVMLVAGDTFRAGAVTQLKIWGERLNIDVISGVENQDPASVVYKGAVEAKKKDIDLLIVDTAGRLQTKTNLMNELAKISRVLDKEIPGAPHETFLIIDATTGQNGVIQAKAFSEVTRITGVVLTKMDGTSKGGIVISISNELKVPIRFIGLGEKVDDLKVFDIDKYLHALCIGEDNGY